MKCLIMESTLIFYKQLVYCIYQYITSISFYGENKSWKLKKGKNRLKSREKAVDGRKFRLRGNGWGSTATRLQSHYQEVVYFLPLNSQKFLVLIWSTLEGRKAELTLEVPSGFKHGTPGLGILHLNH